MKCFQVFAQLSGGWVIETEQNPQNNIVTYFNLQYILCSMVLLKNIDAKPDMQINHDSKRLVITETSIS